jgi:hypothetical protein
MSILYRVKGASLREAQEKLERDIHADNLYDGDRAIVEYWEDGKIRMAQYVYTKIEEDDHD